MKTTRDTYKYVQQAKKRYRELKRELKRAEAALSKAYKKHDEQIRYEHMLKKWV